MSKKKRKYVDSMYVSKLEVDDNSYDEYSFNIKTQNRNLDSLMAKVRSLFEPLDVQWEEDKSLS